MKEYNNLSIEIYSSGTTPLIDSAGDLERIQGLTFDTQYPGGIFGACSFFIPRGGGAAGGGWLIKLGQRLVIRNGMKIVYEGWVIDVQPVFDDVVIGDQINCVGAWAQVAMQRYLNRRYADNRLTEDVWTWDVVYATAAEKADINREYRLRITPKNEAWTSGQYAQIQYDSPVGETIKKIVYDYKLAGANYALVFYNSTDSFGTIVASPGTATAQTYTPSAGVKWVNFMYKATGNVTPASDGTYYGELSNVIVYAKTANSAGSADRMDTIATDVILTLTDINTDTSRIAVSGSPLTLAPFYTAGYETTADIMTRACDMGDAASARWACYLDASETATTPDGKPVMVVEAQPLTTDYDYILYWDSPNLQPGLQMTWTVEDLVNYVTVKYTDADGREKFVTPADTGAGALTDATSIAAWGKREIILDTGESKTYDSANPTYSNAYNAGVSYLAAYKNPRWKIDSPIVVMGYIQNKDGSITPASEIRAGKRVKLGTYQEESSSNPWVVFLISQTTYDDETRTCSITIGPPPELRLPTFSFPNLPSMGVTSGSGGSNNSGGIEWWRRWAQAKGVRGGDAAAMIAAKSEWANMDLNARNRWKKTGWTDYQKKHRRG